MPTVYMSIGIPGAGKTTYLKKLPQVRRAHYVCPDEIREELLGDYRDQSQNPRVWQKAFDQIEAALKQDRDVIVDGAGIERHYRREDIAKYRHWGADNVVAYWFQTPLEVSVERNAARERPIPADVLPRVYDRLQKEPPELSDGFDEIIKVSGVDPDYS